MSRAVVRGGTLLTPEGRTRHDVVIDGGRIVALQEPADAVVGDAAVVDAAVVDADGLLVAPGFIDAQINGGFGIDLAATPERLWDLSLIHI